MPVTRSNTDSEDKTNVSVSTSTSTQDGANSSPTSTNTTGETKETDQSGPPPKEGTEDHNPDDNSDSTQFGIDWFAPVIATYKATHNSEFADSEADIFATQLVTALWKFYPVLHTVQQLETFDDDSISALENLSLKQRAMLILISKIYLDHDDFFTYELGLDVAAQVQLIASKSNVSGPVLYKNLYKTVRDSAKRVIPTVSPSATAGTSIVPTQATTSPKFGLINLKEGFTWTDIFREITRISLQDRTLFTFSKLLGKNKLHDARLRPQSPKTSTA